MSYLNFVRLTSFNIKLCLHTGSNGHNFPNVAIILMAEGIISLLYEQKCDRNILSRDSSDTLQRIFVVPDCCSNQVRDGSSLFPSLSLWVSQST